MYAVSGEIMSCRKQKLVDESVSVVASATATGSRPSDVLAPKIHVCYYTTLLYVSMHCHPSSNTFFSIFTLSSFLFIVLLCLHPPYSWSKQLHLDRLKRRLLSHTIDGQFVRSQIWIIGHILHSGTTPGGGWEVGVRAAVAEESATRKLLPFLGR